MCLFTYLMTVWREDLAALRTRLADDCRRGEPATVAPLVSEAALGADALRQTQDVAARLAEGVRAARHKAGGVDALMLEFSLDSREGIALMCLAEALLRIPDAATRDRLIRDKIGQGDWRAHVGASARRCSSMPRRGACSSPASSSTRAATGRSSRRSRRCCARAASR